MTWSNFLFFGQIESTNAHMSKWAREGLNYPLLLATGKQTSGRGKAGRIWLSGEGSWSMSFLARFSNPQNLSLLTLASALAVVKAISQVTRVETQIKWPNDVVYERKKLAGILLETAWKGQEARTVIGIGLNCNQIDFADSLGQRAISLRQIISEPVDRLYLTRQIALQLDILIDQIETQPDILRNQIADKCETVGQTVSITTRYGQLVRGRAVSLDRDGALLIQTDQGESKIILDGDLQQEL